MMFAIMATVAWAGSAYDVLKMRDGAGCDALDAGARDELIALAEGDVQPGYVPLRAADCLVKRWAADPVVVERAKVWVAEEKWTGLGIVVGSSIEKFSIEDGESIRRAVTNERVRRRLDEVEGVR